jgi:multicomponent Na+:H+ antiporter subunit F
MTPQMLPFLSLCVDVAILLILLSFVVAFVRIALGPTLPDRVVAFDMLALLAVGFIGLLTLKSGQPVFLDAAIALALVAFVGTVAYARYIERCGARQEDG